MYNCQIFFRNGRHSSLRQSLNLTEKVLVNELTLNWFSIREWTVLASLRELGQVSVKHLFQCKGQEAWINGRDVEQGHAEVSTEGQSEEFKLLLTRILVFED